MSPLPPPQPTSSNAPAGIRQATSRATVKCLPTLAFLQWLGSRRGVAGTITRYPLLDVCHAYQSLPRTSPPSGVRAYHQVVALMAPDRLLTLPSASATFMTAVWGLCATAVSHTSA